VVELLVAAGAIILGKTNVSEFGYGGVGHNPLFEITRNPWATHLTFGGSSAGSAVAVATGMVPVALGRDGGGSIRIPAAHCGVYGVKPSMGRVPLYPGCRDERYPGFSGWESIEHLGPLNRTVADSALVLSVIAGPDPRDRLSLPRGDVDWMGSVRDDIASLRVAYSADWGYAAVEPEVREIVAQAVEVFERELGCILEVADPGWEDPSQAFMALVALESDLAGMRRLVDEHPGALSPHLADFVCRPWTAEDLSSAVMARKRIANTMWRFMCCYDLLLTPTLAVPPFAIDVQGPERIEGRFVATHQWSPFAFIMNMTGQPAASVPAGWTKDGLPVGLQIAGRHLDDALVLRASAAFEAATQPQKRWPPMVHACKEIEPARPGGSTL
jgi:aspartyl-tRNA(Asn)/glutamyl-tRNA(Gln) amidotransferase subunit A